MKNWGLLGGVAAAFAAATVYVFWGPLSERKRRRNGLVPGLLNPGSVCFLNSLLQGLASCPSFVRWLEADSDDRSDDRSADRSAADRRTSLSRTLLRLLRALSGRAEDDAEDLLDAGDVLEALRTVHRWRISSFEEQDAHELFHVLTAALEEEERDRTPDVAPLFDVGVLREPELPQKQILCRTRGPPRPWSNPHPPHPFRGRLTSRMVCQRCRHQSPLRFDPFDSLSLSIPPALWGHPLTLDHCLGHFFSSESVKDVVCENCTKATGADRRTTFSRRLTLGQPPRCLCVHLQRLGWSGGGQGVKRQAHVRFGEALVLDPYRHRFSSNPRPAKTDVPSCVYRLAAVVVHCGDVRSGHFLTYRRSPSANGQWLRTSDDSVRKAAVQEVLASGAYLLFYERSPGLRTQE